MSRRGAAEGAALAVEIHHVFHRAKQSGRSVPRTTEHAVGGPLWWLRSRAATRAAMPGVKKSPGAERRGVAPHSAFSGLFGMPGQTFLCRWASSQGCSRRQEIYIIEENQGATSSKCVAKKGSTRALSNPPRYSNEIFYQKESSTHHTRPRFAGAWVGARSSLREPSEAVSGEDQ